MPRGWESQPDKAWQIRTCPSYAHRPVKGPFQVLRRQGGPPPGSYSGGGPHLSARGRTFVHILTGTALVKTDAQTGSLSYPWIRPRRPPIIRCFASGRVANLFLEVFGRMSGMRGTAASCLCLFEPAPGRIGCLHVSWRAPAVAYAVAGASCSRWTCSPMTHIQRTSSLTTATLATFAPLCLSRARWS